MCVYVKGKNWYGFLEFILLVYLLFHFLFVLFVHLLSLCIYRIMYLPYILWFVS